MMFRLIESPGLPPGTVMLVPPPDIRRWEWVDGKLVVEFIVPDPKSCAIITGLAL